MEEQKVEIKELTEKIGANSGNAVGENHGTGIGTDPSKLKPIEIKDVKKPDEYGGKPKDFAPWYEG